MANTKISDFTSGSPAQSTDEFVIARSGANFKLTADNVRALFVGTANTFTATQTFTPAVNTSALVGSGYSLTGSASASFIDLAGTWNTSGTPTAIKLNITNTASPSGSFLMDLQLSSASQFAVRRYTSGPYIVLGGNRGWIGAKDVGGTNVLVFSGSTSGTDTAALSGTNFFVNSTIGIGFSAGAVASAPTADTILTRRAAANLRLGAADAAAPVAQTLSVQSVVAGTTNTAGANLTITGSQGTGTGAGGSIVFQVAPAGSSGTAQNALATALTINSARLATFDVGASFPGGSTSTLPIQISASTYGFYRGSTQGGQAVITTCAATDIFAVGQNSGIGVVNIGPYSFSTAINATADTFLYRDDANKLALRNGAAAQEFRVYNTTDGTNSEFGALRWNSNVFELQATKVGTGTSRNVAIRNDGSVWTFATNGTTTMGGGNVTNAAAFIAYSGTAAPSGGTRYTGYRMSNVDDFGIFFGSGAPTLIAAKGSLYLRTDGTTTNDRMYVNTDGSTTWTAVTTAA